MDKIFETSSSRCGIIKDIRNRFDLTLEFLSRLKEPNCVILTFQAEKWKEKINDITIITPPFKNCFSILRLIFSSEHIFLDVDLKDLDISLKIKMVSSPAFLWFFVAQSESIINDIIKYRLSVMGLSHVYSLENEIEIPKREYSQKISITIYFDECISSLNDTVKIRLRSDKTFKLKDFCDICFEKKNISSLMCCRKNICKNCLYNWFCDNETCPHCRSILPTAIYKPFFYCRKIIPKDDDKYIFFGKDVNRILKFLEKKPDNYTFYETTGRNIYGLDLDVNHVVVDAVTFQDDIWDFVEHSCVAHRLHIHYII